MALGLGKPLLNGILLVALLAFGCGGSTTAPPTREEWFRDKQDGVMTPSGPIDGKSAHEDGNAVIFNAGSATYRQEYRESPEGGYERIGDPVSVPRSAK